jgi:signal transduction histidine kinase
VKIGSRMTLLVSGVLIAALPLYGWYTLRGRRAELRASLEERVALAGTTAEVAFEAALQDGLYEDMGALLARLQQALPRLQLAYIDLAHGRPGQPPPAFRTAPIEAEPLRPSSAAEGLAEPQRSAAPRGLVPDGGERPIDSGQELPSADSPPDRARFAPPRFDPRRAERLAQLQVLDRATGVHTSLDGQPVYVLTLPVHDSERRIAGAVELVASEDDLFELFSSDAWGALVGLGTLGLGLMLVVWLSAREALRPLRRLVEAIDDVAKGDLGRVVLGGNDEVGELAERFNGMTGSLRAAQAEIVDGVEAKLALEARLRHSERLATIGQLAAGIAHEVGTPLNVIGGRARALERKAQEAQRKADGAPPGTEGGPLLPSEVAKNAGIIAEQTQRITRIIQQLLDFARQREPRRRAIDLGEVVRATLDFLDYSLSSGGVEVQLEATHPALVEADADQLQQVCINLCMNALQAMPSGGRLWVRIGSEVRRRPGLEAAAPGAFVVLEVEDTGVGIDPAVRARVFEPFYSTKEGGAGDAGGTGLGLAVSVGIVKDHEGWIDIESPPAGRGLDGTGGPGTLCRVYVPAVAPWEGGDALADRTSPTRPDLGADDGAATEATAKDAAEDAAAAHAQAHTQGDGGAANRG